MKNYVKWVVVITLTFALTLLSGCDKDNSNLSASKETGDSSSYPELFDDFSSVFGAEYASSEKDDSASFENSLKNEMYNPVLGWDSSSDLTTSRPGNVTSSMQAGISSSVQSEHQSSSDLQSGGSAVVKPAEITFKGLWVSYYELPFWGSTEEAAKEKFLYMMQNASAQGYTAVFCHVRGNADAFYPSRYFPFAMQLTGVPGGDPGYDPLKIMIWAAKKCGLEFHAWINPYRVSNITTNPDELAEGHIAAEWLTDGSNRAVVHKNGIYFNPSSTDVQRLILSGIREILENYTVDGIHFDDYFYPEKITAAFDAKQYSEYKSSTKKPLSLGDWRRANVNALVSAAYRLCHQKNVVFGISPAGNMSLDNSHDNYRLLYADIALWMRTEGYVDYILPQLYFGYNHPVKKSRYTYLLNIWSALPKHKNLKFYVGLGAYRMDEECDDKAEWHFETDLMARQATDASLKGASGIAVFSYTSSTSENEHNALQIKNMFDAINLDLNRSE